MEFTIFPNEKGYISAGRAAEKMGYSSDYVGQLCRRRKVPARLIGRTWYVDPVALAEHKKNNQPGRRKGYSPIRKNILTNGASARPATRGKRVEPAYIKPVKNIALTYQNEIGPLLPELFKKASEAKPAVALELIKHAVAFATALFLAITSSLSLVEQVSPQVFSQVENVSSLVRDVGVEAVVSLLEPESAGELVASSVASLTSGSAGTLFEGFLELREIALESMDSGAYESGSKTVTILMVE